MEFSSKCFTLFYNALVFSEGMQLVAVRARWQYLLITLLSLQAFSFLFLAFICVYWLQNIRGLKAWLSFVILAADFTNFNLQKFNRYQFVYQIFCICYVERFSRLWKYYWIEELPSRWSYQDHSNHSNWNILELLLVVIHRLIPMRYDSTLCRMTY